MTVMTPDVLRVEWDPPDPRVLNGANKGYDIDVVQGGVTDRVENVLFDPSNPTGRQVSLLAQAAILIRCCYCQH